LQPCLGGGEERAEVLQVYVHVAFVRPAGAKLLLHLGPRLERGTVVALPTRRATQKVHAARAVVGVVQESLPDLLSLLVGE